ncbi:MAG: hypothetical protein ACM3W4_08005 [Ignavibacteriales bacterium]
MQQWLTSLMELSGENTGSNAAAPLVIGLLLKLLSDRGVISPDDVSSLKATADELLDSPGTPPPVAAGQVKFMRAMFVAATTDL